MKKEFKAFIKKISLKLIGNPFDMAYFFCSGKGLEIGALSKPYAFSKDCHIEYADIHDNEMLHTIRRRLPGKNKYKGHFVKIDHQLKAPRFGLEMIPDSSYDFIYSSHVLEHSPNPIWAIFEQLRVVNNGGYIYIVIPNKRNTYDFKRNTTHISELVSKYKDMSFDFSLSEALDLVQNTFGHKLYDANKHRALEYASEIIEHGEGIHHFYVFDEINTLQMVSYIVNNSGASLVYYSGPTGRDIHFCIRKAPNESELS